MKAGGEFKQRRNQERQEEARKATALEGDKARILATAQAVRFNLAQEKADHEEGTTYDSAAQVFAADEEYAAAYNKFDGNPQAQQIYLNTFKMKTESAFLKTVDASILQQKADTLAGVLPEVYKDALTMYPDDPKAAFDFVENQLFTRATSTAEHGGYDLSKKVAANMLGEIFNDEAAKRNEDGTANTYYAEQYILSGKGGKDIRKKLSDTVNREKRAAYIEINNQRTIDNIAETEQTDDYTTQILNGEMLNDKGQPVTEADIFNNPNLSDRQQIKLAETVRQVAQRNKIANEPNLIAEARLLVIGLHDDLQYAAASGDYTAFEFPRRCGS